MSASQKDNQVALSPEEKQLQMKQYDETVTDFIDALAITKPEFKDIVTVGAIKAFTRFPDSAYGWSANGAMDPAMKFAIIAAHLMNGFSPGGGEIFLLGNKIYVSAKGMVDRANADPNWVILEEQWVPYTEDERKMINLKEGDVAAKLRQHIKKGSEDPVWREGHGIADLDEIKNNKVWAGSVKNVWSTVRTRARRDLLKNHYPLHGVTIADKTDPDFLEAQYDELPPSKDRTTVAESIQKGGKLGKAARQADLGLDLIEAVKEAQARNVSPTTIKESLGKGLADFADDDPEVIQEAIEVVKSLQPQDPVTKAEPEPETEEREGAKAYQIIKEAVEDKHTPEGALEILAELSVVPLSDGDCAHIAKGLRLAKTKGDLSELKDLLMARADLE